MVSTRSSSRHQSLVWKSFSARTLASAVPHEPPPTTTALIFAIALHVAKHTVGRKRKMERRELQSEEARAHLEHRPLTARQRCLLARRIGRGGGLATLLFLELLAALFAATELELVGRGERELEHFFHLGDRMELELVAHLLRDLFDVGHAALGQ